MSTLAAALLVSFGQSLATGPVELVADGFQFTEGPVWVAPGKLLFSDIPADTIYDTGKNAVYKPSGKSNGLTLDTEGRIIRCEHGNRRIVRIEPNEDITVLADAYQGKKLNSPNDAVVRADGRIFFTDPPYGLEGRPQELDFQGVYTLEVGKEPVLLADDFERPNGIALSPGGKTLYVADTAKGHIRAFDLAEDGAVSNGRVHCELHGPDGIRVDTGGRIWATSRDGIMIFDAAGKHLETIAVPQIPANCTFGGPEGNILFITARTGVYRVPCQATGLSH